MFLSGLCNIHCTHSEASSFIGSRPWNVTHIPPDLHPSLSLVAHISPCSSILFVLTFSGPLQSPRTCIVHPRGQQFPSSILPASQIFSTSLPPTPSLPLTVCVYSHVGLRLWVFPPPPSRATSKCITELDVLWLRLKATHR